MKINLSFLFFFFWIGCLDSQEIIPLPQAHAHNDYDHKIPLHNALAHGFTSVEADILNIRGRLYIGHNLPEEKERRPAFPTLRGAYLEPLYKRYIENDCQIFPGYDGPFYLWIDIKNRPLNTYRKLVRELTPFKEMLSRYERNLFIPGKVTVIISGYRPIKRVMRDRNRMVVLDGRIEDMELEYAAGLMPFISQHIRTICELNSDDTLSAQELEKLKAFVKKAHVQNRKVRLWGTPEKETLWDQLLEAKVSLINTDQLLQLQEYLLK